MLLTRSQLLGANKRRFKNVPLPDGIDLGDGTITRDAEVRIRSLTEGETAQFEMSNLRFSKAGEKVLVSQAGMEEHRRRLLRLVLVDGNDNTLLGPDDDPALLGIDGLIAATIYAEACKHCGLKERDDVPEKKDLPKTSVAAGTGSSPAATASPTLTNG